MRFPFVSFPTELVPLAGETSIEGHVACFTLTHCCLFVSSDNEDSPGSSNFHGNKYDGDDDLVIDWQE